jgi:hypothetical protein
MDNINLGGKIIKEPLIQIADHNGLPCYQVWARDKQDWNQEFKNKFRWHSFAYTFVLPANKARQAAINMLRMSGMFN